MAAEAAEAAGAQGRFWEMHDRLMADSDTLPVPELVAHAEALDLDVERFENDLRYHVHAPAVAADVDSARRSGAPGRRRSTSTAGCWIRRLGRGVRRLG